MWSRYRQLYQEVRASYPADKARTEAQEEWLAFLIFRPVSYVVTPLFLLAGLSANQVTGLAILTGVALPVIAAVTGAPGYGFVVAGLLGLQVLAATHNAVLVHFQLARCAEGDNLIADLDAEPRKVVSAAVGPFEVDIVETLVLTRGFDVLLHVVELTADSCVDAVLGDQDAAGKAQFLAEGALP